MPFSPTKIFLEETSLVARPALGFQDLKDRLKARMAHLGIKVTAVEEEEYCLIPMGGVLPRFPQRVLGIGGTAGMVHPSTGACFVISISAHPNL
jgi:lycopene beta-cyclase